MHTFRILTALAACALFSVAADAKVKLKVACAAPTSKNSARISRKVRGGRLVFARIFPSRSPGAWTS